MKIRHLAIMTMAGALMTSGAAWAGDVAKGKAIFDSICSDCHEAADFKGEAAADIEAKVKDVVSGKTKHKKKDMKLTPADMADVAAFYASQK